MNKTTIEGKPVTVGHTVYIREVTCPYPLHVKFRPGRVLEVNDHVQAVKLEFQQNKTRIKHQWFAASVLRLTDKEPEVTK